MRRLFVVPAKTLDRLVAMGKKVVPLLVQALENDDFYVRVHSMYALERLEAKDELLALLKLYAREYKNRHDVDSMGLLETLRGIVHRFGARDYLVKDLRLDRPTFPLEVTGELLARTEGRKAYVEGLLRLIQTEEALDALIRLDRDYQNDMIQALKIDDRIVEAFLNSIESKPMDRVWGARLLSHAQDETIIARGVAAFLRSLDPSRVWDLGERSFAPFMEIYRDRSHALNERAQAFAEKHAYDYFHVRCFEWCASQDAFWRRWGMLWASLQYDAYGRTVLDKTVDLLKIGLQDPDPWVRIFAAEGLNRQTDIEVQALGVPVLIELVDMPRAREDLELMAGEKKEDWKAWWEKNQRGFVPHRIK